MTPENFINWLEGYLELTKAAGQHDLGMTPEQVQAIEEKLTTVNKPSYKTLEAVAEEIKPLEIEVDINGDVYKKIEEFVEKRIAETFPITWSGPMYSWPPEQWELGKVSSLPKEQEKEWGDWKNISHQFNKGE